SPEQQTCILLTEKDSQWRRLDCEISTYISQIDCLHNAGHGNSPDCIKLSIKKRECQDRIELLEDELLRIGSCPLPRRYPLLRSELYSSSLVSFFDQTSSREQRRKFSLAELPHLQTNSHENDLTSDDSKRVIVQRLCRLE
ncbi:hypothetical protein AVEN_244211-1, partial [Araneus ventricosus]